MSVKLLDQHRAVFGLVGPAFHLVDQKDTAVKQGPQDLTWRKAGLIRAIHRSSM